MTLNISLLGVILSCVHECIIFKVPSFTDSKDMIAGKLSNNGSRKPEHAH